MALVDLECKNCKTLEAWLEKESQEKKFFLDLVLKDKYADALTEVNINDAAYFPVASRGMTLSHIRQAAREASRVKDKVADKKDLTDGEQIFQENLSQSS